MKHKTFFFKIIIIVGFLMLSSCEKEDEIPVTNEKKFVVDKIYDYNNDLVAEYFYDNQNKLIKKSVTEHLGQKYQSEWAAYTDEFEYQNGLVSKIIHKDISYNLFNYETYIFYNSKAEITKTEVYKNNQQISSNAEYLYKNGLLTRTIKYNFGTMLYEDSFIYSAGNVNQYTYERPETDLVGNPIPETKRVSSQQYNFDKNPSPNFNLKYLFIYEPLPFREDGDVQRQLSINNMTEAMDGSKWIYTYNQYGLPSTIEVKWKNVQTAIPMLLRLEYKEIN